LVTDPMAIAGDVRGGEASTRIKRGFAAEVLLGVTGTALFALMGVALVAVREHTFGMGMLAIAPWLPVLVVQDYWRWVGFMSQRPGRALANDTVFNCVQGAAFTLVLVAHVHSVAAVVAAWGLGGAFGAVFGLRQNRVFPTLQGGLSQLVERWSFSKWLAGTSLANSGSNQMYQFVVAAILGPAGLGALKAAQTLVMGPAGVLIQAGGSIGLPEATKAYAEKGWAGLIRVCRVVMVAGLLSGLASVVAVALWGRSLLTLVYGPTFAHLQFAAVLIGFSFVSIAAFLGPVLVIKATGNTRWLLQVQLVYLVVSVASGAALSAAYGVNGAAASIAFSCLAALAGYRWFQHRAHGSICNSGQEDESLSGGNEAAGAIVVTGLVVLGATAVMSAVSTAAH
jgi:O-antigen/teichoic acid export membrane protein